MHKFTFKLREILFELHNYWCIEAASHCVNLNIKCIEAENHDVYLYAHHKLAKLNISAQARF